MCNHAKLLFFSFSFKRQNDLEIRINHFEVQKKKTHAEIDSLKRQLKQCLMRNEQLESQIEILRSGENHLSVSDTKHISRELCLNKIEIMCHLNSFQSAKHMITLDSTGLHNTYKSS